MTSWPVENFPSNTILMGRISVADRRAAVRNRGREAPGVSTAPGAPPSTLPFEDEADVVEPRDERRPVDLARRGRPVPEADDFGRGEPEPLRHRRVHRPEREREI